MNSQKRFDAICKISDRRAPEGTPQGATVTELFAQDVFDRAKMERRLSPDSYRKLLATMDGLAPLDSAIADEVAAAMKDWAVEQGATHYTHWFQPLTGGTAEKHDSFLSLKDGKAIFEFSGKNLIVGEPDASSFPTGGLRSTFEARGYTAWDPTSPAFIKRHSNGATLCIPTVFCSYTGDVLDKKTPLLRSAQVLKKAVSRLLHAFNRPDGPVALTLGAEQEYFLVDKKFYLQRPDLLQTGRTLFGAPPAKHQQLEDHYFGAIPARVLAFMTEVELELWKLGIPAKTRHNEVAPAQFELAPIFEDQNLAVDHNMLVMEVLRQVADRHGLVCLLHEKPFAGINGSGKHNNWSLSCNGRNLLDPGSNPRDNALFLTLLTAVLRAVDLHSDLLRATTAGIGNDCRLGANEAPPPVMSVFLGEQLSAVIDQLVDGSSPDSPARSPIRIGVDALPTLVRDATDRNRTSPFAFTGNKFEFRSPGASQSCAEVNMVLNAIVAESVDAFAAEIEAFPPDRFNADLQSLLRREISAHRRIVFNGDGYTREWREEARRRGLPEFPSTLEAIQPFLAENNQALFEKYGILTKAELASRVAVRREDYSRRLGIELAIAREIAENLILPVAMRECARLCRDADWPSFRDSPELAATFREPVARLLRGIAALNDALAALKAPGAGVPQLASLREAVDAMELLLDDALWPLPKYREMLFIY